MGFIGRTINNFIRNAKRKKFAETLDNINHSEFVKELDDTKSVASFCHLGHLGDIIYSIPAMYALSKGKPINLYLDTTVKNTYNKSQKHHSATTLTAGSVAFIKPLILSQKQFAACKELADEHYDYNLDYRKKYPFDFKYGSIVRWYFLTYGITYNTTRPWLYVEPNNNYKNAVIIARSFRYRSPAITYSFLNKYNSIYFVGLPDEFEDMKLQVSNIKHLKVNTALDLARVIAGSKLFIGNQSFPFSVAEALKVKRVLEVDFISPNVIVDGDNGYDFCYQPQFEKIIKNILE